MHLYEDILATEASECTERTGLPQTVYPDTLINETVPLISGPEFISSV